MRHVREAGLVQTGQQAAGVGVAEVALLAGDVGELRQHGLGDAARAVAAAREPDGVDRRIGHRLAQRRQPLDVGTGEMARAGEALRVDDQFRIAAGLGDGGNRLGGLGVERATRRDDGDPHGQKICTSRARRIGQRR